MATTLLPSSPAAVHDGRPAPAWATRAAHLVSLVVLPSGLWRLGVAAGLPMGMSEADTAGLPGWESLYIASLTIVNEALALLTLGLVKPWGERAPGWIPFIGGRRVPPRPVVVVAATGAVLLQAIWLFAFRDPDTGIAFTSGGWKALFLACYYPLLLWAPLLAAVTVAYYRRRCRD
jgi:hypothetical protein